MGNKFDIAFKIRPKHGKIYSYMVENNLTLDQVSNLIGISIPTLSNMLHFKWRRSKKETICKLEKFFKCPFEELFPIELIDKIETDKEIKRLLQTTSVIKKEIDIEYLPFYSVPQIGYTPNFDKFELEDLLNELLHELTPREEKVLRMRFISGYTLDEIGKELNVQQERIRQIEEKALSKLRDPSRAKKLRNFVKEEER